MDRRTFFKHSSLASTSLMVPGFLRSYSGEMSNSRAGKILVVVQLSGGNDGLNTIVPFSNDIYYQNRPGIAISKKDVLKISSDDLGFNPAFKALRPIFDRGEMSIVNSVGYPNPDRSHFRSMDIWQSASSSDEYLSTGWIGRYLDNECAQCLPYHAMEIDDSLSLALKGAESSGFAMKKVKRLIKNARNPFHDALAQQDNNGLDEAASYLYKTMIDTQESADYLFQQSKVYESNIQYPNTSFGKDLKNVAALITADTNTKIYYVNLGGFDTHAGQLGKQGKLLTAYAEGIAAFIEDLKRNNLFDDTLILSFSEFGRRLAQNGSGGTDHGAANNLFLMGGRLQKPGFYNAAADLSALLKGDIKYQIDFRSVYADIINKWLDKNPSGIIAGQYETLNIF